MNKQQKATGVDTYWTTTVKRQAVIQVSQNVVVNIGLMDLIRDMPNVALCNLFSPDFFFKSL